MDHPVYGMMQAHFVSPMFLLVSTQKFQAHHRDFYHYLQKEVIKPEWRMKPPKIIFSIIGTSVNDDEVTIQKKYKIMLRKILTPLNNVMLLTSGKQDGVAREIAGKALRSAKEREPAVASDSDGRCNIFGVGITSQQSIKDVDTLAGKQLIA